MEMQARRACAKTGQINNILPIADIALEAVVRTDVDKQRQM
jgi:hypothetical protein